MNPFFEYELVPCEKPAYPALLPLHDLTQNLETAQAVIDLIQPFFKFSPAWPIYSGAARRAVPSDGGGVLYVQIWKNGAVVRSIAFRDCGYVGILHLDYPSDDVGQYRYQDLVQITFDGYDLRGPVMMEGIESETLALIDGATLTLPLPWR